MQRRLAGPTVGLPVKGNLNVRPPERPDFGGFIAASLVETIWSSNGLLSLAGVDALQLKFLLHLKDELPTCRQVRPTPIVSD